MISNLFAILGLCFLCFLFWQQRRQSELAKNAIAKRCQKLDLQLLSVALKGHKVRTAEGNWIWHTVYHFEFSALGDDAYQGRLVMQGFRPMHFNIPPYRMP